MPGWHSLAGRRQKLRIVLSPSSDCTESVLGETLGPRLIQREYGLKGGSSGEQQKAEPRSRAHLHTEDRLFTELLDCPS